VQLTNTSGSEQALIPLTTLKNVISIAVGAYKGLPGGEEELIKRMYLVQKYTDGNVRFFYRTILYTCKDVSITAQRCYIYNVSINALL